MPRGQILTKFLKLFKTKFSHTRERGHSDGNVPEDICGAFRLAGLVKRDRIVQVAEMISWVQRETLVIREHGILKILQFCQRHAQIHIGLGKICCCNEVSVYEKSLDIDAEDKIKLQLEEKRIKIRLGEFHRNSDTYWG